MKTARLAIPVLLAALALASCASAPVEAPVEVDTTAMRQAKTDADSARTEAEEVKAPRGAKAEFEEAEALYAQAVEAENGEDYESALELYTKAGAAYKAAAEAAVIARDEALAAMKEADAAISETETAADEALQAAQGEDS
jgi:tetratricopeptide (TPR) repeat protein